MSGQFVISSDKQVNSKNTRLINVCSSCILNFFDTVNVKDAKRRNLSHCDVVSLACIDLICSGFIQLFKYSPAFHAT
jgi:hypothetical protein